MIFKWWEKILCVMIAFCSALDPFFTYYFAQGKSHIMTNEINQIFVWVVVNDISPFLVFLSTLVMMFIVSIISLNLLHNYRTAYLLWVSTMFALCFLRPLAGLSWYYATDGYILFIKISFVICSIVLITAIMLCIIERLNIKVTNNDSTS